MAVKISEFIIGIIFVGAFIGILGLFMANMSSTYGVAYDNTSLEAYNNLQEMNELAEDIEEGSNIEEKTGVIDVIGGYFSSAYNALKITTKSMNTFDSMTDQAVEDANLGAAGDYLKIAIITSVIILIIVGVVLSAILKKDV